MVIQSVFEPGDSAALFSDSKFNCQENESRLYDCSSAARLCYSFLSY